MFEDEGDQPDVRDLVAELDLPIGLIELGGFRVLAMSRAAEKGLGRPAAEVVGRSVTDLMEPDDRPKALAALQALADGVVDFYRAHRPLGEPGRRSWDTEWVRAVTFDHERHALVEFGRSGDGTSPLTAHFGHEPGVLAVGSMDAAGVVTSMSADVIEVLGVRPEDLIGHEIVGRVAQRDVTRLVDANRRAQEVRAVALRVELRDGSGGWRRLCCILASRAASQERCFLLLPDPELPADVARDPRAALQTQLAVLAAEVSATGLLAQVGAVGDLSRFPQMARLTGRQWEVLSRLVAGQRASIMAEQMFVSSSTVRNHLSAVFEQFGVHSQAELLELLRSGSPLG